MEKYNIVYESYHQQSSIYRGTILVKLGLLNFDQKNIVHNCNRSLLDLVISNNKFV